MHALSFASPRSIILDNSSSVIFSEFFLLADKLIPIAINSFPTYGSGK